MIHSQFARVGLFDRLAIFGKNAHTHTLSHKHTSVLKFQIVNKGSELDSAAARHKHSTQVSLAVPHSLEATNQQQYIKKHS